MCVLLVYYYYLHLYNYLNNRLLFIKINNKSRLPISV